MREFIYWHIKRPLQRLPYWIAWKMPRWLVYYCTIRLFASATTDGNAPVVDMTAMEALRHWRRKSQKEEA